jgi:hypothetical protein
MSNTQAVAISELSDTELDAVAAGTGWFGQVAIGNFALQLATNNQLNAAVVNVGSSQGGNQTNNNNAGNQFYR